MRELAVYPKTASLEIPPFVCEPFVVGITDFREPEGTVLII